MVTCLKGYEKDAEYAFALGQWFLTALNPMCEEIGVHKCLPVWAPVAPFKYALSVGSKQHQDKNENQGCQRKRGVILHFFGFKQDIQFSQVALRQRNPSFNSSKFEV
jgi:hypothetical protein